MTISESMTFVLCVGPFKTCRVNMPGLGVSVETTPGDLYIFPGGDVLHEVERCARGQSRWSWIIFHHSM
jgi:hypothetical protein